MYARDKLVLSLQFVQPRVHPVVHYISSDMIIVVAIMVCKQRFLRKQNRRVISRKS